MSDPKPYQCRHIFTEGRQCGSSALTGEIFCYFHHTTRRPPRRLRLTNTYASYTFTMPEDRASLQHSINEILTLVAANDIEPRRAGLLLYGLSIASNNLANKAQEARHAAMMAARYSSAAQALPAAEAGEMVTDMIYHPDLGPIAAEPEPQLQPTEESASPDTQTVPAEPDLAVELPAPAPAPSPAPALVLPEGWDHSRPLTALDIAYFTPKPAASPEPSESAAALAAATPDSRARLASTLEAFYPENPAPHLKEAPFFIPEQYETLRHARRPPQTVTLDQMNAAAPRENTGYRSRPGPYLVQT